jgi:NADPH:quinone reductase-like Zn-dependent oxidoreductase
LRAIVRQQFGGPEQLLIQTVPDPEPAPGEVLVKVRAFGLNRAEQYFRQGLWGEVAVISGIECVGSVEADPSGRFDRGQTVIALMGGMGRSRPGSYAEMVCVPASNVVAVRSRLDWARLASLPETYATAWSCLHDNLALRPGDRLLVRGAGSALGQAAVELAARAGAIVLAQVRSPQSLEQLLNLGASAAFTEEGLDTLHGLDAVLDLVGTTTLLDSLRRLGRGGRVCLGGFLGGGAALAQFDPMRDLPSGRQLASSAAPSSTALPTFRWPTSPSRPSSTRPSGANCARSPPRCSTSTTSRPRTGCWMPRRPAARSSCR